MGGLSGFTPRLKGVGLPVGFGGAACPRRQLLSPRQEWEERRRQNIEKMNEEMVKIAEYERNQRVRRKKGIGGRLRVPPPPLKG